MVPKLSFMSFLNYTPPQLLALLIGTDPIGAPPLSSHYRRDPFHSTRVEVRTPESQLSSVVDQSTTRSRDPVEVDTDSAR